ncbi:MAG: MerR family transcriptional regulator [Tidjanibacter sp.]|nr:MerR family transcriptional regulator [Tidjanibacter sp.]
MKDIVHAKGKLYYSMGEVCEIFGVKPSLIRHWENEFRILRPSRNSKGNRMYTPKDVDNIKLIYHLVKEKGMTLAGADKRLRQNPDGIMREAEVVEHLQHIRSMLVELRTSLGDDENVVAEFDDTTDDLYTEKVVESTIIEEEEPKAEEVVEEGIAEEAAEEIFEEAVLPEPEVVVEVAEPVSELELVVAAEPTPEPMPTPVSTPTPEPVKKPTFVEVAMFPDEEPASMPEKKEEQKPKRQIVEQTLF